MKKTSITCIILLSIVLLSACNTKQSQTTSSSKITETSSSVIGKKAKITTNSTKEVSNISYDKNTNNEDINNIISIFEKENIAIYYDNKLGFYDYVDDPDRINKEIYGEDATMIVFNTVKESGNKLNTE